jgi:hypothetical protein
MGRMNVELEKSEQERERLSKLLIEARIEIVQLWGGIKKVLKWRNLDGDGISDPLRQELYELIGLDQPAPAQVEASRGGQAGGKEK